MKTSRLLRSALASATPLLAAAFLFNGTESARAQGYPLGATITNDFSLQNRLRWTNDNGQVFAPSNTQIRLSDFDGKILFLVFWDVW